MNPKIKVISTGKYLPENKLTNFDLEKMVSTTDEWIESRTGIKERRKAEIETNAELAYKASINALEKIEFDKNNVDLIIVATMSNENRSPSIANLVQAKLGLNDKQVMAFDINAACSGFIYALEVASTMLMTNKFKTALVIGSEKMTHIMDYTDRNTCILFGDGAGAMLIQSSISKEDETFFYNDSKGDLEKVLYASTYLKMDGKKVFQFATQIIPTAINKVLEYAKLELEQIDGFIFHQANKRIIDHTVKSMGIDSSKVLINIDKYGNTSAASIPIALDEYKQLNPYRKKVLLVGFGGGFTWGSAVLDI